MHFPTLYFCACSLEIARLDQNNILVYLVRSQYSSLLNVVETRSNDDVSVFFHYQSPEGATC